MMKTGLLISLIMVSGIASAQSVAGLGLSNEDALRVQSELYEPPVKVDAKTVQRTIYKGIFKQDMKETRPSEAPEEE